MHPSIRVAHALTVFTHRYAKDYEEDPAVARARMKRLAEQQDRDQKAYDAVKQAIADREEFERQRYDQLKRRCFAAAYVGGLNILTPVENLHKRTGKLETQAVGR